VLVCAAALQWACGSGATTGGFEALTGGGGTTAASGSVASVAVTTNSTSTSASSASGQMGPIGGDRPVKVHVPPSYDSKLSSPLLLMLHGYSASGDLQELYLSIGKEAGARGYLFAHPDGTIDSTGMHFWNATNACCDLFKKGIDDSTYLSTVIAQIKQSYNVDPKRVYLVGHSNGGFMSHRMACDHSDQIAAIASLAGSSWKDPSMCKPKDPMHVLVMHGTLDAVILYGGGSLFGNAYPGAMGTAESWAALEGCAPTANESLQALDLTGISSKETKVLRWNGCKLGGSVEHWRIEGSGHVPLFNANFKSALFDFFEGHPKI
jgi:polyhydroxybutyrate depolymerase